MIQCVLLIFTKELVGQANKEAEEGNSGFLACNNNNNNNNNNNYNNNNTNNNCIFTQDDPSVQSTIINGVLLFTEISRFSSLSCYSSANRILCKGVGERELE